MKPADMRIGFGYDIHRFAPSRPLYLGGVRIPSSMGLEGHSDADVLLHAICDALLGSAGQGDIGKHFPNTSKRYKNIRSLVLLDRVGRILTKRKLAIANIDSTIVLEHPKILKYVPAMRRRIARGLGIDVGRVSVKATTNEGLDSIGSRAGCAAFAVALVHRIGT